MPRRSISQIDKVAVTLRQPAVTVDDLALMLAIDLTLGRHRDFQSRLQRALDDACRQGQSRKPSA